MSRAWLIGFITAGVISTTACGGQGGAPATSATPAANPAAPAMEARWLRGLWANDIKQELAAVGITCKGPAQENRTNVWLCESGTPLVRYQVRFYGNSPGKIEYLNAVVTQSGPAKDALCLRLFGVMAGLHFEGADRAQAMKWLETSIAGGGTTVIGPAKYKLAGDANRRTFDVKASGSEW